MSEHDVGFYVMAAPALKGLLDEFRLVVGDEEAASSLYRYGKRCGASLMEALGIRLSNPAEVAEAIPLMIAESGLGKGEANLESGFIVVCLSDSLESRVMRPSDIQGCYFTSGYLAGIVGGAMGKRCDSIQEDCTGAENCVFRISSCEDVEECDSDAETLEPAEPLDLEGGIIYILKEDKPHRSYKALERWLASGRRGLCVTREFPDKLKKKYSLEKTDMIWLSSTEGRGCVDPTKLSSLFFEVQMFMQSNPSSMVLLSGLEFLVTHNGFLSVLKLIHLLSEQASVSDSVIILPINPAAFDSIDMANLEREAETFPDDA